jgi:hypothetical protein
MLANFRPWWNRRRADVICLVVLAVLATLFMHRWLRPGYTSVPLNLESAYLPWHGQVFEPAQNLLISDAFHIFYPGRLYLTESLRQGVLPLWNPYLFSGHPLLGDTNIPNYYPPNLLAAFILPPAVSLPVLAWLHVILSGSLMYLFLRVLGMRPETALLGSIPWMLSEFTVVWLESPDKLSTMAWMPGMFACLELAICRRRIAWAVMGGLAFGLEILGGQTQIALYSAILLGLYAILHSLRCSWTRRRLDTWPIAALVVIGAVGVGVGAIQLFPAYQLAKLSYRVEVSPEALISIRLPLRHLVTLWLPDFFGNALRNDYRGAFNFVETAIYFGVVPALLGSMSLFVNPRYATWFAAGLFAWIVSVAGGTWLVRWVAWLPGFSYFNLSRLAGLLAFPGAILAAGAVEELFCQRKVKLTVTGLIAALVMMVLVVVWAFRVDLQDVTLHWLIIQADLTRTGLLIGLAMVALMVMVRWPHVGLAGLVALTFVDLYQWGEPFNPIHPSNLLYPQNQVVDILKQDTSIYRVLPIRANRTVFGPGVLLVYRIAEIGGSTSLTVQRCLELVKAIDPQAQTANMVTAQHFEPLYSLLNVKYVLSPRELPTSAELARYEGCARQTQPLTGSDYFDQSFTASRAGLNRIDVTLARVGRVSDQPVRFRLWRGNAGDELLADITSSVAELPDRDPSTFFFAPVPDSMGDRFTWRIEAPGAQPDAAIAICLSDRVPSTASFVAYGVELQQVDMRQGVWIYENPNVLPRAYIVHHAQVAPSGRDLEVLQSPQFNIFRTVTLDAPLPADQAASLSPQPVRSEAHATITRYEAHRVDIEAQTPIPGILVLADVDYPGWQVSVDGKSAQLLQVNHALRGVYLPVGVHSISFSFRPVIFYVALGVTGLTVVLSVALLTSWRNSK